MPVTVSITLSDADAARVTAAATAAGAANGKAWVIDMTRNAVKTYERGQALALAMTDFDTTTPIAPT